MYRPSFARTSSLILTFALTFALAPAARADDASLHAKAEEMVTMLHTEKAVQQIADNITRQIDEAAEHAAGADATAEQKAKVEDFKKQAAQLINANLSWTAMKSAVVDLYAKSFTEEQLDSIIAFYKTPAGAVFLEKMPEVNVQFGQIGNARVAALRDPLQKAYQELQQGLRPAPSLGPVAPSAAPGKK